MNKTLIIYLFLIMGLVSCQSKTSNTTKSDETQDAPTKTEETADTGSDELRIFDSFEELAPLFQTQSDSLYIVNFWATWCKPCVAELPYFMQLAEEYKDSEIKFLYVSLDFKKQIDTKLKPFIEAGKIKGDVVVITDADFNSWIDKVSPEWTGSIPATLVFDRNKRGFYEQSFEYEELKEVVEAYLKG